MSSTFVDFDDEIDEARRARYRRALDDLHDDYEQALDKLNADFTERREDLDRFFGLF